jgi:hypothetical protein
MIYIIVFGFLAALFVAGAVALFFAYKAQDPGVKYALFALSAACFVGTAYCLNSILTPASVSSDKVIATDEDLVIYDGSKVKVEALAADGAFQPMPALSVAQQWSSRSPRSNSTFTLWQSGLGALEGKNLMLFPDGTVHFWSGKEMDAYTSAVEYPEFKSYSGEALESRFKQLATPLAQTGNEPRFPEVLWLSGQTYFISKKDLASQKLQFELVDLEQGQRTVLGEFQLTGQDKWITQPEVVRVSDGTYFLYFNSGFLNYAQPLDFSQGWNAHRFSHLYSFTTQPPAGSRLLRLSLKKGLIKGFQQQSDGVSMLSVDHRDKAKPKHHYWRVSFP